MILLVVDTQKQITNAQLYNFKQFEENIIALLKVARNAHVEVIFVRHDDGVGEALTKGEEGYEIYEKFQPLQNEKIFDKKVNSPFKETQLLSYLKTKEENDIVVVGLQSEYCIDATIKCGFEHGFQMFVPAYCNTTIDNMYMSAKATYEYYNEFIWKERYAQCISFQETMDIMEKSGKKS